jgi:nucleoside-diphosphate-sugar epimerase
LEIAMRVFVTGATGFIGKAVVQELIGAGHSVVGLARNGAAAAALKAAGATPFRGSLADPAGLRKAAAGCDGAIHLAFMHGIGSFSPLGRARLLLGGAPSGIAMRFLMASMTAERRAIDAVGAAFEGSGRPLATTFPTMSLTLGRTGVETDAVDPAAPGGGRGLAEASVQTWADRGVRAMVIRLPPAVHDERGAGFVNRVVETARKQRQVIYVGDGANRWGAAHKLDVARLYRLALENGVAGARYHGVAEEGVAMRDIAEVIGRRLTLPVVSKTPADAAKAYSWIAAFVAADNPVSGQITQERLGWRPTHPGLLADIDTVSYLGV